MFMQLKLWKLEDIDKKKGENNLRPQNNRCYFFWTTYLYLLCDVGWEKCI